MRGLHGERKSQPEQRVFQIKTYLSKGKGGLSIMVKRTELKCPFCDTVQMRVKNCKDAELICHNCGASLLMSKDENGALYISARPQDYEPPKAALGQ